MDDNQAHEIMDEIEKIHRDVTDIIRVRCNMNVPADQKILDADKVIDAIYFATILEIRFSVYSNLLKYRDEALTQLEIVNKLV